MGRTLVHALRQELIQQLQALGFMPSAYSCESATLSHWPHRDRWIYVLDSSHLFKYQKYEIIITLRKWIISSN